MAKTIKFLDEIQENQLIRSEHISQLIEAFSGADEYNITITGDLTSGDTSVTSLNINNNATIDGMGLITTPKVIIVETPIDPTVLNPSPEGQIVYYQGNLFFSNSSGWFKVDATQLT